MTKRIKPFWIKERHNPQLGVYYVAEGRMSKTRAKQMEGSIYGYNIMRQFDTEEEYEARIAELVAAGHSVQRYDRLANPAPT